MTAIWMGLMGKFESPYEKIKTYLHEKLPKNEIDPSNLDKIIEENFSIFKNLSNYAFTEQYEKEIKNFFNNLILFSDKWEKVIEEFNHVQAAIELKKDDKEISIKIQKFKNAIDNALLDSINIKINANKLIKEKENALKVIATYVSKKHKHKRTKDIDAIRQIIGRSNSSTELHEELQFYLEKMVEKTWGFKSDLANAFQKEFNFVLKRPSIFTGVKAFFSRNKSNKLMDFTNTKNIEQEYDIIETNNIPKCN